MPMKKRRLVTVPLGVSTLNGRIHFQLMTVDARDPQGPMFDTAFAIDLDKAVVKNEGSDINISIPRAALLRGLDGITDAASAFESVPGQSRTDMISIDCSRRELEIFVMRMGMIDSHAKWSVVEHEGKAMLERVEVV
jgi:hypothetical protein